MRVSWAQNEQDLQGWTKSLQYQSRSLTSVLGFVSFGPVGGICPFSPTIPWGTTTMLWFQEGCLSYPILVKGECS